MCLCVYIAIISPCKSGERGKANKVRRSLKGERGGEAFYRKSFLPGIEGEPKIK